MEQRIVTPIYHVAIYRYRPTFGMRVGILHKGGGVYLGYANDAVRYKTIKGAKQYIEKFVATHTNALAKAEYNFLAVMHGNEILCEYSVEKREWEDVNFKLTND